MSFSEILPAITTLLATMVSGHVLSKLLAAKPPPKVEAGKVFLDIEAQRRRDALISQNGVRMFQVGKMPQSYSPRLRDDLHELGVVNRLSEAQRSRLKFERQEEI